MERIIHRITLDVNKGGIQRVIQGIETGDKHARQIAVSLANGKEVVKLPMSGDGIEAVCYVMTPSAEAPSINPCEFDGDDIIYNILPTDVSEAGRVSCQIKLISTDARGKEIVFVSPRFALEVWESDVQDSEAQESAVFNALEKALLDAKTAYNETIDSIVIDDDNLFVVTYKDGHRYESTVIQDALKQLSEIDEYVKRAEVAAESAERSAIIAGSYEEDIEEYAQAADKSAKDALVSELKAKASEDFAKLSESNAETYEANARVYKEQAEGFMASALSYKDDAKVSKDSAALSESNALSYKNSAEASASGANASAISAAESAASVLSNSKLAESYAKGGTGTREGEDYDNAKYYMEQAKAVVAVDIATTEKPGIVKPDGTTITVLPDGTISAQKITIDDELSDDSENPVQNKVVKAAIDAATPEDYETVKAQVETNRLAIEDNADAIDALDNGKEDKGTSYTKAETDATLANKADSMTYDENNETLYLKSGNKVLSSVEIAGGGMSTIIHVDTHEESWKGNENVLVEIFDDTEDYRGHFDANGDYFHKVKYLGEHLIRVTTEDGDVFEDSVNVETAGGIYYIYIDAIPDGEEVIPVNDVGVWLKCAGVRAAYTTIDEILSDSSVLNELIQNENAVKYMVRSTDFVQPIASNENAMTYIGLDDNCSSVLLDEDTWRSEICDSTYFEKVLTASVPNMTSFTEPSGQVISSSYGDNSWGYTGFQNSIWASNNPYWIGINSEQWWYGYVFDEPVKIYKYAMSGRTDANTDGGSSHPYHQTPKNFKIQYSDDGNIWNDVEGASYVKDLVTRGGNVHQIVLQYFNVPPTEEKHRYWRVYITSNYGWWRASAIGYNNYYGRS